MKLFNFTDLFQVISLSFLFILVGNPQTLVNIADAAQMYNEAPELKRMVEQKHLPAVDERLPYNPMIIQPVERIGSYGGTWHMGMKSEHDHAVFIRYTGYENLLRWDSRWTKAIPNVAQSYKTNINATEYIFTLRQNMRWSDGHPFTADDILFWYEDVLLNKELTPQYPPSLVVNQELVKVRKIDDYKVSFSFTSPYGVFPQILAQPHLVDATTYPKHYLKQFLPKYNSQISDLVAKEECDNWIELFNKKFGRPTVLDDPSRWQNPELPTLYAWQQTGPYRADSGTVVSVRNPYYWKVDSAGNQLPYIDKVERTIKSTAAEIADLAIAGKIDMQRRRIDSRPKSAYEAVMKENGLAFFETLSSFSNTLVIALNMTHRDPAKRKLFQNKDFRIGLSHAIDRKEITATVPGMAGDLAQPAPRPETPYYDEEFSTQFTNYDTVLANQLLEKAGCATKDSTGFRLDDNGKRINLTIEYTDFQTGWDEAVEKIAQDWNDVGIETTVIKYTREELYKRKNNNQHDAVVWLGDGGISVILEPRWYFPYSSESNFAQLWQRWYNHEDGGEEPPEIVKEQMRLYDQLKATADEKKQSELMKEILTRSKKQFYAIGISLPTSSVGIRKTNFHNVPAVMPYSWLYPTPAPTNPCHYFIE